MLLSNEQYKNLYSTPQRAWSKAWQASCGTSHQRSWGWSWNQWLGSLHFRWTQFDWPISSKLSLFLWGCMCKWEVLYEWMSGFPIQDKCIHKAPSSLYTHTSIGTFFVVWASFGNAKLVGRSDCQFLRIKLKKKRQFKRLPFLFGYFWWWRVELRCCLEKKVWVWCFIFCLQVEPRRLKGVVWVWCFIFVCNQLGSI